MNLKFFLLLWFLNAFWILGVKNAFQHGQILGFAGDWMEGSGERRIKGHLPEWATKPLISCPPCMASMHGTLWWLLFEMGPLHLIPVYVVCLSGLMKCVVILVLNRDSY